MKSITRRSIDISYAFLILLSPLFPGSAPAAGPVACSIQQGACISSAGGMSIEFDIQPKPVKSMSKLQFSILVKRNGKPVKDALVALDLTMPGMYMGRNAPTLKHTADGRFEGTGIITRCMSGSKSWQADISVEHGGARQDASFQFEVQ